MKVGIVGAGNVGATIAFILTAGSSVSDIVLVDKNEDKARGEVLDLRHCLPFTTYAQVDHGGLSDLAGMDLVVITAGMARKAEESRLDLARRNVELYRDIIPRISDANREGIFLIVSNPLDIQTYAAIKFSGKSPDTVFGSGNILDTARFRSMLAEYFNVNPVNVHSYMLGEHGQSAFPVLSQASIGCTPIRSFDAYDEDKIRRIAEHVRSVSTEVIKFKGSTYYAIGMGVAKIIESIYLDENSIMPVSTLIDDYYGVGDVCLSVPAVINQGGVERIIKMPLDEGEQESLKTSADRIGKVLDELGLRD
jgi:L-lactate dehydrogenase